MVKKLTFLYLLCFQALPLVSVFVGRKTDKGVCRILTLAPGVDSPTYVEFPAPSSDSPPPVGTPKWANYVKGVVAHFKGKKIFDPCRDIWTAPSENDLRTRAKCTDSESSHACAKSHPDICFPLVHSVVSNDSVSGQGRP